MMKCFQNKQHFYFVTKMQNIELRENVRVYSVMDYMVKSFMALCKTEVCNSVVILRYQNVSKN